MSVILKRISSNKNQTIGILTYNGVKIAVTLELPWKNNQNGISCIPKGTYCVVRRKNTKYGNHFHITGVPSRSYILIHNANYYYQLKGCVAVGKEHIDINKDGNIDVTDSVNTMKNLLKTLPLEFELTIM